MNVKLIAKIPHTYGTRRLQAKDEYEAHGESDARLMVALGRAERAPTAKVKAVPAPAPTLPTPPTPPARKTIRAPRWPARYAEPTDTPAETPAETKLDDSV